MTSPAVEELTYPSLEPILDAIAEWVERYRHAAGLRDELAQCGREEVARIAHSLGVSSTELARLASKGPHAADLLKKLLVALRVDSEKLAFENPAAMRDLQRLCITCSYKQRCEHELAAGTADKNYRSYCPNSFALDALFLAGVKNINAT